MINSLLDLVKRAIAWPLAHGLYYVGHAASKVLNAMPDWEWRPWRMLARGIYVVYSKSMLASLDLNNWGGLNVWRK